MAHISGFSPEAARSTVGKTPRTLALVPGMIRPRQAMTENCSGRRGLLFTDFQVSCTLKKNVERMPSFCSCINIKINCLFYIKFPVDISLNGFWVKYYLRTKRQRK